MSALAKLMMNTLVSPSAFLEYRIGDALGTHFRLQVVGGYFGAGKQDALLAGQQCLTATAEEEGHVRVLLGFGDARLA